MGRRRTLSAEFRDEAVRQVIDPGRSFSEVARNSRWREGLLAGWICVQRARRRACGTELDTRTGVMRAVLHLCK